MISYFFPLNCNSSLVINPKAMENCRCPSGYEKFWSIGGPYCATNSQKPCSSKEDCPEGERCISSDGKKWFCSGVRTGCYFWDPERLEMLCAD
jgi:hypothetical protein